MIRYSWFLALLLAFPAGAANITFQINMNGYTGFEELAVSGTFNEWCGNCHILTDADQDGIWITSVNIPAGNYQYKFSFGNWAGQENLTAASGCVAFEWPFVNRVLSVAETNQVLDPVCWGLCSNCLEPITENWELTWSDEFDSDALNTDSWTYEYGASGWGNNELQNYTDNDQNIAVGDGMLTITARENSPGNYTSARIITNDKVELKYGKIEARIKVPFGQGIWPAFWMLGANFESVSWPDCGEIDIMEHVNNEPLTNAALHWNYNGHTYRSNAIPFDADDFHVYGIIWNESGITYTLDAIPFWERTFSETDNSIPIFQNEFFFLLNIAVGGTWPGNPDATTEFPVSMEVDYIRVFNPSVPANVIDLSKSAVHIYPIPAREAVTLSFAEVDHSRRIHVYNSVGQHITSERAADQNLSIQTIAWDAGVYLLQIVSENGRWSYNIVIE